MEEEVGEVLEVGVEVGVLLLLLLLLLLLSLLEGGGYVVVALNSLSAISIFNADTDSNLSAVAMSISGVAVRFLSLDGTYEGTYTTGMPLSVLRGIANWCWKERERGREREEGKGRVG